MVRPCSGVGPSVNISVILLLLQKPSKPELIDGPIDSKLYTMLLGSNAHRAPRRARADLDFWGG